jgi:hypothetical protein
MPEQSPTFQAASELLHMMMARATDGGKIDPAAYRRARGAVLSDLTVKTLAPECVHICREPDNVWAYIKGSTPELPTYASRRAFLTEEFEPLLGALERFASSPLDSLMATEAEDLNSASVLAAWSKALERRAIDPDGAITAARTLLESVCKTILDDTDQGYKAGDDLPKLYYKVSKTLKLTPSDYGEEQIKRILGGATSVVEGIGRLSCAHPAPIRRPQLLTETLDHDIRDALGDRVEHVAWYGDGRLRLVHHADAAESRPHNDRTSLPCKRFCKRLGCCCKRSANVRPANVHDLARTGSPQALYLRALSPAFALDRPT